MLNWAFLATKQFYPGNFLCICLSKQGVLSVMLILHVIFGRKEKSSSEPRSPMLLPPWFVHRPEMRLIPGAVEGLEEEQEFSYSTCIPSICSHQDLWVRMRSQNHFWVWVCGIVFKKTYFVVVVVVVFPPCKFVPPSSIPCPLFFYIILYQNKPHFSLLLFLLLLLYFHFLIFLLLLPFFLPFPYFPFASF